MSYETDKMLSLINALRNTDGLKRELSKFNASLPNLKLILYELERANDLKEVELGIQTIDGYKAKKRTRGK